jgi:hypothetical protein
VACSNIRICFRVVGQKSDTLSNAGMSFVDVVVKIVLILTIVLIAARWDGGLGRDGMIDSIARYDGLLIA